MASYKTGHYGMRVSVSARIAQNIVPILQKYKLDKLAQNVIDSVERYRATDFELPVGEFPLPVIRELLPLLQHMPGVHKSVAQFLRVAENPKDAKVGRLTALPIAIARLIAKNPIDGWVYRDNDNGRVAYALDYVRYYAGDGADDPAHVVVTFSYNSFAERGSGIHQTQRSYHYSDIVGKTAEQILFDSGYLLETPELKEEYLNFFATWREYQPRFGQQFSYSSGTEGDSEDEDDDDDAAQPFSKLVNNDVRKRTLTLTREQNSWAAFALGQDFDNEDTEDESGSETKGATPRKVELPFTSIPVHPFITFFNLISHRDTTLHVAKVKPYVYDPTCGNKLVLPPVHRDLIDTLTSDLSIFSGDEDIVRGKSGGTPVLCYGLPGLGKTLTAEVYSEIVGKPLYRVHSGQLGTHFKEVEQNLETILKRAEAWGCILLIDEADVYISKRGNDLDRNAVVAAFLRTLEYFNGLLFLTTNRADDIDDAILSRMIATVRYEMPDYEVSRSLWGVLGAQFKMNFSMSDTIVLATTFTGLSGRDIKQLIRLTSRYCASKKIEGFSLKAFEVCAMFRGLN